MGEVLGTAVRRGRTGSEVVRRIPGGNIGVDFHSLEQARSARIVLCRTGDVPVEGSMLSVLLVCAVVASLGVGVLVAYGICAGMFRVFRMHAQQVAERRRVGASVGVKMGAVQN